MSKRASYAETREIDFYFVHGPVIVAKEFVHGKIFSAIP